MVNICVLHFAIGSQTPPNNTRHIMDTHIHHLHTFLVPSVGAWGRPPSLAMESQAE